MGVQILLGGAGSGKTTFLMNEVIAQSQAHPEQRFFYLVPEQYTAEIEDALIRKHPSHGLLNIEVLSMTRLAYRIFGECGAPEGVVLDDNGKNMLLTRVARENAERLPVLGAILRRPGYIAEMKSVLSEWTEYRVTPEELSKFCEEEKSFLGKKVSDLVTIYEAFESAMAGRFYMAEELLLQLIPKMQESALIKGAVVVLDGYTGFTPTQRPLIGELIRRADKVYAAVTADKDADIFHKAGEDDMFALSKGMVRDLMAAAKDAEAKVFPLQIFEDDRRHEGREDLKFLTEHFHKKGEAVFAGDVGGLTLLKATSPEAECRGVAEEIRRLVRTKKCRYKDIAVIMSDAAALGAPLQRAFDIYSIPGFFDTKRSILKNPACELVRSLLNMADRGYDRESIMRFLRSGLLTQEGVTLFHVDEFENYILAHGIRHYGAFLEPFTKTLPGEDAEMLSRVNGVRDMFVHHTEAFRNVFKKPKKTAGDMTEAVKTFLETFALSDRLKKMSEDFQAAGNHLLAMEFDQVYDSLMDALTKVETLLGDEVMTTGDYRELLEAAFSEAALGLIPQERDMVLAGDLMRTRLSDVKYLFVMGADDTALPGEVRKNGLLSERDREKMKRRGITLSPGAREKAYIQLFYLYQQLSKAEEKIVISYSALGADGKVRRPAALCTGIRRMFPNVREEIPEMAPLGEREFVPKTGMEAFLKVLQASEQEGKALPEDAGELYAALKKAPGFVTQLEEIRKKKRLIRPVRIESVTAEKLYGDISSCGVTRLERYSVCAFAHFMRYGIEARPRAEYGFHPADWGNMAHKVLEIYSDKVRLSGKTFGSLSREEQAALAERALEESLKVYDNTAIYESKRSFHQVERLQDMLKRNIAVLTQQVAAGCFEPAGFEVPFQGGKIDRVDLAKTPEGLFTKVIDYKTGRKTFALPEIYGGISLQLPLYLAEALRAAEKAYPGEIVRPAGLFYYHIDDPIIRVTNADADVEKEILKRLRPDGLFVKDDPVPELFDRNLGSSSLVISGGRKTDGSLSKRSRCLPEKDMAVMPVYATKLAKKIRKDILDGEIAAYPYELDGNTPCTYCPYKPVCRFDMRLPGYQYRRIENDTDAGIIKKMKEAIDER